METNDYSSKGNLARRPLIPFQIGLRGTTVVHLCQLAGLRVLHPPPLGRHRGFTGVSLDFIINHDIKYRMGGRVKGKFELLLNLLYSIISDREQ